MDARPRPASAGRQRVFPQDWQPQSLPPFQNPQANGASRPLRSRDDSSLCGSRPVSASSRTGIVDVTAVGRSFLQDASRGTEGAKPPWQPVSPRRPTSAQGLAAAGPFLGGHGGPAPPKQIGKGRAAAAHGAILAQKEAKRAALEEELWEPPLAPVPVALATPLERRMADVLQINGGDVPRLPHCVQACQQGNQCCWRWLARAALEQVTGGSLSHLSLGEAVATLRDELEMLRCERAENEGWKARAESAEDELTAMRGAHDNAQRELTRLREVEKQSARLQSDCADLRVANGRLAAQEESALKDIAKLKQELQTAADRRLAEAQRATDALRQELQEAEAAKLATKLTSELSHKRRMQRVLDNAGIVVKPARARSTSRNTARTKSSPR